MNGSMPLWPRVGLSRWIANASADLLWMDVASIPVTRAFVAREKNATYITAPRSGWIDYVAAEINGQPLASLALNMAGRMLSLLGIDKTLFVGNFPVSTSNWDTVQQRQMPGICAQLALAHPDYFVGVRNILPHRHADLIAALADAGFHAYPARVIYEFDFRQEDGKKFSHLQRDLNSFNKSKIKTVVSSHLSAAEAARIHILYTKIYLEKHSLLNAQYTVEFFADLLQAGVMQCLMLKSEQGDIISFALLCEQAGTLFVPALGYDESFEKIGSYRMLFAAIHTHAKERRILLNYSSGAGDFKRKRGGIPYLEYTYLRRPANSGRMRDFIVRLIRNKLAKLRAEDLIRHGA